MVITGDNTFCLFEKLILMLYDHIVKTEHSEFD